MPLWWTYHAVVTRKFAARTWRSVALITAVTFMTLWPLLTHGGRAYFFTAAHEAMVQPYQRGDPGAADLLLRLTRLSRLVTGELPDVLVNAYVRAPMLNFAEVGLILIGFAVALANWRRPRATIAAVWLAGTIVAVAASSQPEAGRRLSVAIPAIGILAASGFLTLARWRRYTWVLAVMVVAVDVYLNWKAFCAWSGTCS
jgi:hypothetical protein